MKKKIFALVTVVFFSAKIFSKDILMLGLDKEGAPVEVLLSESKYKENLKTGISGVLKSTIPILKNKSDSHKGWMLRSAVVGLGVNMEVGIGKLKLGFLPRFRVGFSNAKEPSVP